MLPQRIGRYKILNEIGSGAMAAIYRARDEKLGREVAIKVLHAHLSGREENIRRFHREAHAVAQLDHPNIVGIYDYSGEDSDSHYIVTEYIDGMDLSRILERINPVPAPVAAMIISKLAEAVSYAHSQGIIHRDIKLENVILSRNGSVKLTDFGIAHIFDWDKMTLPGALIGSPYYMAPEIISGSPAQPASDIFSMGVLFYRLVTGVFPFEGSNPAQVLKSVLAGSAREPESVMPSVDRDLSKIIMKCIHKDSSLRYRSMDEFLGALREYMKPFALDESPKELAAFYSSPSEYWKLYKERFSRLLIISGKESYAKREYLKAINLLNRALSIDGDKGEITKLLNRARFRRRVWLYPTGGFISVIILLAGLKLYEETGFNPLPEEPESRAIITRESGTTPKAEVMARQDAGRERGERTVRKDTAREELSEEAQTTAVRLPAEQSPSPHQAGWLIVRTNPWADVFVNNKFYGRTPFLDRIELPAGRYLLEVKNPYAETMIKEVEIKPERLTEETFALSLLPGEVSITLNTEAKLYVDGRLIGSGMAFGKIYLSQGRHTIRAEREGYRPVEKIIEITAGKPVEITLNLVRESVIWKN